MIPSYFSQVANLYDDTNGIMICDAAGYVEYLRWMPEEYLSLSDCVGMHITEVYPDLDENTSTVMQTLKTGKASYDVRQQIRNCKGMLVDIVTTTLPIFHGGNLIGAITASVLYDSYKKPSKKLKAKRELYVLDDIITQNSIMQSLKERCTLIAESDSPVLLYGETGTGKELFAQSLHTSSSRRDKPFISQNCAAIPETLLEGIFFGAEKGSFTGAETRKGLFELADGGTLFLDEINSMDISMQAKLLKVIEEQKARRLGGYKDIHFQTRILCATNQPPIEAVHAGKMREDLFYRLSVVRMDIPPLRERREDIPLLTDYFIQYFNQKMGKNVQGISALVQLAFEKHAWSGNIRELRNVIEGAFNMMRGNVINMTDIPQIFSKSEAEEQAEAPAVSEPFLAAGRSLTEQVQAFERQLLQQALSQTPNLTAAAKLLKISRQNLSYKLEKYGLFEE